eukprot:1195964-Prorocentrum_minimum.AAC.5
MNTRRSRLDTLTSMQTSTVLYLLVSGNAYADYNLFACTNSKFCELRSPRGKRSAVSRAVGQTVVPWWGPSPECSRQRKRKLRMADGKYTAEQIQKALTERLQATVVVRPGPSLVLKT